MNKSGHYEYARGKGWVKTSDAIPNLASSVYFNKGGVKRYDPSARETFESKSHKRQWMKENGLKEMGIIKSTDKRWEGHTRNALKPTFQVRESRRIAKEFVVSQGGTKSLLDRLQNKRVIGGV
jgi:hypothetical protein